MANGKISMRQLMVLLLLSLLPAMTEQIGSLAGLAGAAAWLVPAAALLPVLAVLWGFCRRPMPRRDLGLWLRESLGKGAGGTVCLLLLLWAGFLLSVHTARCGRSAAAELETAPLFSGILLLLALWAAWKGLPTLARTGEIFFLAVSVGIGALILLVGLRLAPEQMILFSHEDLLHIPKAALPVLGNACLGVFALTFWGETAKHKEDGRWGMAWTAGLFLLLSLLTALVLGRLGAGLTAQTERPFFHMVAGIGVRGAFQRLEALFSALWSLGEILLLSLLLTACRRLGETVWGAGRRHWTETAAAAAAFLAGNALRAHPDTLDFCLDQVAPAGNLLIAGSLAILLAVCGLNRKKQKK